MEIHLKQFSHIKQAAIGSDVTVIKLKPLMARKKFDKEKFIVAFLAFFCASAYAATDIVENVNLTKELSYLKAEAFAEHLNACKADNAKSCSIIGNIYFKGDGMAQNFAKAVEPLTKACNQGEVRSCTFLGEMYEKGNAVKKDINIAITIYQKSCYAGDPMSCNNLAVLYEKNLNWAKAVTFYRKACDSGDNAACMSLLHN
jgi:TPR repeat protein